MTSFYFQIKGLDHRGDAYEKWAWPPLFSGRVQAEDRQAARKMVEDMYGLKFPMRVKADDASEPFLLHIKAMTPYLEALFEQRECKQCRRMFRRIDLYNDQCERYKGTEFCSQVCADAARAAEMVPGGDDPYGTRAIPCIYRITYRPTGQCYIGQTKQAFTLRWWQHVKWGATDCKFHTALRESNLTDWTFEVVEVCDEANLDKREAHWIEQSDAIRSGFNTANLVRGRVSGQCALPAS